MLTIHNNSQLQLWWLLYQNDHLDTMQRAEKRVHSGFSVTFKSI